MSKSYLVIVESPAKCGKIAGFLNDLKAGDFLVEASMGHIRTIDGLNSVNINKDFATTYTTIPGKQQVITKLRKSASGRQVILATDPDREGEGIAYHVADCLGIHTAKARRMTFNEITKGAVQRAFAQQRGLDMDLVNAQRTRQILDLLVGFEISPVLWAHIAPKLSAGRCQSPALRLIAEREEQITKALAGIGEGSKRVVLEGEFKHADITLTAQCEKDYPVSPENAYMPVIENAHKAKWIATAGAKTEISRAPPAPFTTSTIQQEASRRFGLAPSVTMKILQKLYEAGRITYMRTDSTMISPDAVGAIKDVVVKQYGAEYHQGRDWNGKKAVSAQEAHECIRPTHFEDKAKSVVYTDDGDDDVSQVTIEPDSLSQKMYDMVWCRTVASQMTPYREEQTPIRINAEGMPTFITKALRTTHMGWRLVYGAKPVDQTNILGARKLTLTSIMGEERMASIQGRYNEASLIRELERLGIGRPSTYSGIVETLMERGYVKKDSRVGQTVALKQYEKIGAGTTKRTIKQSQVLAERNKMYITDLGREVNAFLVDKFKLIMDYKYTAHIEERLDGIAKGSDRWVEVARALYDEFHPIVASLKNNKKEERAKLAISVGEDIELGTHPNNKAKVYVATTPRAYRIYQQEPEREAWVKKDAGVNMPSLAEAVVLLEYPKDLGKHNGASITIRKGPYGYYLEWNEKNISLPPELREHPEGLSLDKAVELIKAKENRVIKEYKSLAILNGQYGAYIRKGNANYSIPRDKDPASLTLKDAEAIISHAKTKPKRKWAPKNAD